MPTDTFQVYFLIYTANNTNLPSKSHFKTEENQHEIQESLPLFQSRQYFHFVSDVWLLVKVFFYHKLSHFAHLKQKKILFQQ